jgi:predicted P-loop ATPase
LSTPKFSQKKGTLLIMAISIEDLKKMSVWVNWKLEERGGKQTKIPYNPRTGGKAQSNNRDTWTTFGFAQSKSADYSGIGFMFADGICGIDIDNKTGNPDLDKQAETIITLMDTYTERSPSGTGWHIIFRCDMSKIPTINGKLDSRYYYKNPHNDLECYFPGLTNRYFTYTGQGNGKNIEERTEQILIFLENYMLKDNFKKRKEPEQEHAERISVANVDIIDKIRQSKQGYKFSALFDRGDTSAYNNDDSAADEALCYMLAWWLQGDFNEIDHYFRQSRLYREKWERTDYRTATINKAIDAQNGNFYKPPGRPKKEKIKREYTPEEQNIFNKITERYGVYDDDKLTISGVALYLEQNNIRVKYNEITRKINTQGLEKWDNEYLTGNLPIYIYNNLNLQYKKCTMNVVQDFLKFITMQNAYNPVLDMINAGKWDGVDHLPELFRIMRINDSDKLSKTLIHKWLWQNLSMLRNKKDNNFGADGLLVLKGGQGIGKTSFARKMALTDEFFGESLTLDIRDKDTVLRAISCWIGELGEIESTFKSDINAIKGFITLSTDKVRVPYGREADDIPRRTSFIGTCNSDEYLIDETGNRRYWTVPIDERIDLEALEKFDALQLYLQINEQAKNNIQGFRLTWEENQQLAERNGQHEKLLKGEQEIKDILYKAEQDNLLFEEMTVTEFKGLYPILRSYTANQIGIVLKKLGITTEIKRKDGKTQKIYSLPRPKYRLDIKDFN